MRTEKGGERVEREIYSRPARRTLRGEDRMKDDPAAVCKATPRLTRNKSVGREHE